MESTQKMNYSSSTCVLYGELEDQNTKIIDKTQQENQKHNKISQQKTET